MISLKNLPWRNLKGYAGRTVALLLFSALMSIAAFGGGILTRGIRNGLATVEGRLGADIMVTPGNAKNEFDAQSVLLQAEPGYFFMDDGVLTELAEIDGVEQLSPQLFMASTKSGCCSARLQMIAYDPATDFTVQPWIRETYGSGTVGRMDVVVGSNVTVYESGLIRFYDNDCRIVGQFAPTGSTLDNCVYMNFDTVRELISASYVKGLNSHTDYDPEHSISAVMIRVTPGADIEAVADAIRTQVPDAAVTTSKSMVSGIADSLDRISGSIGLFIWVFWVLGLVMAALIFNLLIRERRREFATLAAMGAGRKTISALVTKEALLVNLLGGTVGIVLSAAILVLFRSLIEQQLGVGVVLPSAGSILLWAAAVLLSAVLAAVVSSRFAVRSIGKTDVSQVLKEGE